MSKDELKELIETSVEQKLLELLGDPDEGLEIRKSVRDRLLRQKKAVAAGERGEPFEDKVRFRRAYRPTMALAKAVEFRDGMMEVYLTDGRIISVPLIWFPLLYEATPEQREQYEIGGGGISLHWSEIDEDLSVAGLLAGADWESA
jgi:hypothetical protein